MTDEEALEIYNSMVLEYGDKLPDFEHYPIQFKYYYKLFKWTKKQNERTIKTDSETSTS
jgi:hypothetical protein